MKRRSKNYVPSSKLSILISCGSLTNKMDNCIHLEDFGDFDPCELLQLELRTARKKWRCGECGEDNIHPGDIYEHAKWKQDDDFVEHRTCARCLDVAEGFFRGRVFGGMVEYFEESHGFDYRDGIPADFTPCGEK